MYYYTFNINDHRGETAHLSNEEDLCYRRLIDMYFETEKPIRLDTQWVARRIRVDIQTVQTVLEDMFEKTDEGWRNEKCEEELEKMQNVTKRNQGNGKKGGRPKNPKRTQPEPAGFLLDSQDVANRNPEEPKSNPEETQNNPEETQTEPKDNPEGTQKNLTQYPLTQYPLTQYNTTTTEEYRRIRGHSVSVSCVGSFLDEGFTQAEIDAVLDDIERSTEQIKSVPGLMRSWLKKRRANGRKPPGTTIEGIPCPLLTHAEVNQGNLWKQVSLVRIEGVSACLSANGKVLYARNSDIEQFGLTRREPKAVGEDWPD